MVLFEFKKGNPERLEGRLLVYAHNLAECKHTTCKDYPYLGIYSTYIMKRVKDLHRILKEPERTKQRQTHLFKHSKGLAFDNLDEILTFKGDIVDGGEIICTKMLYGSLIGVTTTYMINYFKQLMVDSKFVDSYLICDPKDLKAILYQTVEQLHHFLKKNKKTKYNNTVLSLKEFTTGAPFSQDINNLLELLPKLHTRVKPELTSAIINKIVAIHGENYEVAAECNQRIVKLFNQKSL